MSGVEQGVALMVGALGVLLGMPLGAWLARREDREWSRWSAALERARRR